MQVQQCLHQQQHKVRAKTDVSSFLPSFFILLSFSHHTPIFVARFRAILRQGSFLILVLFCVCTNGVCKDTANVMAFFIVIFFLGFILFDTYVLQSSIYGAALACSVQFRHIARVHSITCHNCSPAVLTSAYNTTNYEKAWSLKEGKKKEEKKRKSCTCFGSFSSHVAIELGAVLWVSWSTICSRPIAVPPSATSQHTSHTESIPSVLDLPHSTLYLSLDPTLLHTHARTHPFSGCSERKARCRRR